MNPLRPGLPALPSQMSGLPIDDRGYPIPWFVATMADGTRDFRIADERKRNWAVDFRRCWICGGIMGSKLAFVIGPMCCVNRNTSEPAAHRVCAEFAVRACPFMILPKAEYRNANLPDGIGKPSGFLDGNPGCTAIWITCTFKPYTVSDGSDWLIEVGDPLEVTWWCRGRAATRSEVQEAIDRRIGLLRDIAIKEGEAAMQALDKAIFNLQKLLPRE